LRRRSALDFTKYIHSQEEIDAFLINNIEWIGAVIIDDITDKGFDLFFTNRVSSKKNLVSDAEHHFNKHGLKQRDTLPNLRMKSSALMKY
jgi:hypothetical protein